MSNPINNIKTDLVYDIEDDKLREYVNQELIKKASIKVWNVVTNGGADPTGIANADAIFTNAVTDRLNEYDYIFIPSGTYNLTKNFYLTNRVIVANGVNNDHLFFTDNTIQYGSQAFSYYKSHLKESDGHSFQGFWEESNGQLYCGNRKSDGTSNQIRIYDQYLNLQNTYTNTIFGHINSLIHTKDGWFNAVIAGYIQQINDFASANVTNRACNGISNNIDLINYCKGNVYVLYEENTNYIHFCKYEGGVFTSEYHIQAKLPTGIVQVGMNGLCYYKGNIYIAITDNGVGYGPNRNYIQIYNMSGELKSEWILNENYEAKEIEGFQVKNDGTILILEYGNSSIYTDENTFSLWRINPYETGLEFRNTTFNSQGLLGKQNIYVNSGATSYGDGSEAHPFKSLQSAIDYASTFQPTVLFITGTFNEDILVKTRVNRLEFNGGTINGHIEIDGCFDIAFTNVTCNYSGDYQMTADHSNVAFSGCTINMSGGQSGNGFLRGVGLASVEFVNTKFTCRNICSIERGTRLSVKSNCSGNVYNAFYNQGGIIVADLTKITHTYISSTTQGGITSTNPAQ